MLSNSPICALEERIYAHELMELSMKQYLS